MADEKIKIGEIELSTIEAERKVKKVDEMLDALAKKATSIERSINKEAIVDFQQKLPKNLTLQQRSQKAQEFYANPPKGIKTAYSKEDEAFLAYNKKMQRQYQGKKGNEEKLKLALNLEQQGDFLSQYKNLYNKSDSPNWKYIEKSVKAAMKNLKDQLGSISNLQKEMEQYGISLQKLSLFNGTFSIDLNNVEEELKKSHQEQIKKVEDVKKKQKTQVNTKTKKAKITDAVYDVESNSMYELSEDYTMPQKNFGGTSRTIKKKNKQKA